MSSVEDKIKTLVIQVVTSLINKKYNVIIEINLDILHMNAGRSRLTKENMVKTSRATPTLQPTHRFWHVHCASPIECNLVHEIPCDIWYLDPTCSNHMTSNLNLFSSLDKSAQTNVTLRNNTQVNVLG